MAPAPDPLPDVIFHICTVADWQAAQAAGVYRGGAAARADGFLHLSTAAQVAGSLTKHFPDRDGILVLTVRTDALGGALRWEPSRGGAVFPHLYGDLPLNAVLAVRPAADVIAAAERSEP